MYKDEKLDAPLEFSKVTSFSGEVLHQENTHDAVFGEITEDSPNYRNVGWIGTTVLMVKTQIGLGVLSIPLVFHQIGLIPGVIAMLCIAATTTWSDYMVGAFKIRHPEIYGVDDVGYLLFGQVGRIILGGSFCIFFVFTAASGLLSISIGLNTVSSHGTCTAVFVGVAAIAVFLMASIRTLGRISWIAWVGTACIISAIFTLTIAVGLQNRPATAPQPPQEWSSDWQLVKKASFQEVCSAISSLVFAYAGTGGFFPIASEMRDPRHFTRSLLICQSFITSMYLLVGIVVYYFCGSYVASPALGSAGPLLKKVCYGIALPGLLATTVLPAHITSKYVFVHILRGSRHLASNSPIHWVTWFACTGATTLAAYIIASSIPNFGGLIAFVGALLGPMLCYLPMGCMWLYDNYAAGKQNPNWKWRFMVVFSVFILVLGFYIMGTGTYGSVEMLIQVYHDEQGGSVWSCADNSSS